MPGKIVSVCQTCRKKFSRPRSARKQRFCSFDCYLQHHCASPEERFWRKVQKTSSCWIWTAATRSNGYGVIFDSNKKLVAAHRFSWELHFGPIPADLCVCHHCDQKLCVRADHLFLGSKRDNSMDAKTKGRLAVGNRNGAKLYPERISKGINRIQAKLAENDVHMIRALYTPRIVSLSFLAKLFRISPSAIYAIVSGKYWKHLL